MRRTELDIAAELVRLRQDSERALELAKLRRQAEREIQQRIEAQAAERVRQQAIGQQQALLKADALLGAIAAIAVSSNLGIGAREKAWVRRETCHIPLSQAMSAEAERLREREAARFAVRAAVEEGLISKEEGRALGLFPSDVEEIKDKSPGEAAAAAKAVQWAVESSPSHPVNELRRVLAEGIADDDTTKVLSTLAYAKNKHGQRLAAMAKPASNPAKYDAPGAAPRNATAPKPPRM